MAALTIPRALALLGAAMSLVAVAAAGQRLPGLGYSPFGPVPFCLPDAQVQSDVQRLGRVSQRVRIYGVQCNNTHAVLAMAQSLGLQVLLGVWLSTDTAANEIVRARQGRAVHCRSSQQHTTRQLGGETAADRSRSTVLRNAALYAHPSTPCTQELQAMESVLARWGSQAQGLLTAVAVGNEVLGVNGGTLPALLNYLDRARAVVQKHAPQTPLTCESDQSPPTSSPPACVPAGARATLPMLRTLGGCARADVDIPEVWLGTHGTMTVKGQGLPPAPARAGMLPCPAGASAAVCALLRRVDVAGVNIHPYHAGLPPTCAGLGIKGCYDGPTWVLGRCGRRWSHARRLSEAVGPRADRGCQRGRWRPRRMAALRKALNTSQVLLAEVGWPSAGEACCSGAPAGFPSNATFLAVPSAQSSAAHLATFVATAAAAGAHSSFPAASPAWRSLPAVRPPPPTAHITHAAMWRRGVDVLLLHHV